MIDYEKLAGKDICSLTAYKPGKPIAELKRELGLSRVIKIASNENPYGPSPKVASELINNLAEISRYPLGDAFDIRTKVAKKYGVLNEELSFGTGSNELIELLMRTFLHNDDYVVSPSPSFPVYGLTATAMGTKCDWVRVDENFNTDMDEILRHLNSKTRIVFLANPNNPIGNYINQNDLEYFMKKVPENVIVVMDEAYIEFAEAGDMPDTLNMQKRYENMILLRTFSKAYGLAGLRIGYAIANKVATDMMNRVRQPFNTNMLAQIAATVAIDDDEWLEKIVKSNAKNRAMLYAEFDKMGLKYTKSQTNFILVNVLDGKKVFENLLKKGVIVRFMGNDLPEYIRVSIGTDEENETFIKCLKEVI